MCVQSCLTLCDPMGYSLPGSPVHGILQARILELSAISSSRDLPDSGIEPESSALVGGLFTTEPKGNVNKQSVLIKYLDLIRRRQWHPIPVILPGKSHGRRSLVGYSPWGRKESDTTKRFHFHFLLSCIGEGNGNPLQHSCLENPRDGGAWWAAVFGVAQSRTLLKQLSSSISMTLLQGNQHFSVPRTGGSEGHGMLSAKARAVLRPANRHSVQ